MALFNKDFLNYDETVFKEPLILDYDYLPHILKFRENQQRHIATVIKPLFSGRIGSNLLITGSPGIGKTAACRYVLREMEQFSDKIAGIYINCWKHDTAYKVLVEICQQLGYKWIQNKKTDELMSEISKIFNKKAAVIILDEVDKLKEEQIIYQIVEDIFKKCIILITNDKEYVSTLDPRTKSRLLPEHLEFKPYTEKETYDILEERARFAFYSSVIAEDILQIITEKTFEESDIRIGLFLLKESGNAAENRSSKKISLDDVDVAMSKITLFIKNKISLDEEEKELLNLVKENNGQPSSKICEIYSMKFNKSDRTFRRKISTLKENKFVEVKEIKDMTGNLIPHLFAKNL
jgi:cell division control protein 6